MRLRRCTALAMGIYAAWSCSSERSAGNSMETENSLSSRLIRVDSITPPPQPDDTGAMVATLRLDAQTFEFAEADKNGRGIGIEHVDGRQIPFEIPLWDSAARIGRMRVRIEHALLSGGGEIRLRWGLGPSGPVADPSATWKGIAQAKRIEWTSALVDDFEDGNLANQLPIASSWRAGAVGTTNYSSPVLEAASKGRPGTAMRVSYSATNPHYVVIATSLGSGPNNLRALDSLVFWARGNGKLFVALEHLVSGVGPKAWLNRKLDTNWTRICVQPKDFDSPDPTTNNFGWERVRDSVTDLSFILQDGSEVRLDDIRLHGVVPGDLR